MLISPIELREHEVAGIFPSMSEAEYRGLRDDIEQNGQAEPIWVDQDGKVIDGRHRVRACADLGREVDASTYSGTNVVAFVVSLNLKRRMLDESQRAMVAARIANMSRGDNQHTKEDASIGGTSQSEAAEQLNVSPRSVQRAAKVIADAVPELVEAVEQGKVTVSAAALATKLPPEKQLEILASAPGDIGKMVREEMVIAHETQKHLQEHAAMVEIEKEISKPIFKDKAKEDARIVMVQDLIRSVLFLSKLPRADEVIPLIPHYHNDKFDGLDAATEWILDFSEAFKERVK